MQVKTVPEDSESVEALKLVMGDITTENFVVMSVDLITNVRLQVGCCQPSYLPVCAEHGHLLHNMW